MKKIKLAVVGCLGRMGKEIIKEINDSQIEQVRKDSITGKLSKLKNKLEI